MAIIVRDDGGVIDANVDDIDFADGLTVIQVGSGIVQVDIPDDGVAVAKITATELAERIRDVVAATILNTPSIAVTYDDLNDTLELDAIRAGNGSAETVNFSDHTHEEQAITARTNVGSHGDGFYNTTATCNAGEICVGGGITNSSLAPTSSGPFITQSRPSGSTGWLVETYSLRGVFYNVTAYALCKDLTVNASV